MCPRLFCQQGYHRTSCVVAVVIGILTVTCMHKWVSVEGEHLRCRLLRGSRCLSKAAGVQCLHSIESISKGHAKDVNAIHRVAHEGRDVSLDLFFVNRLSLNKIYWNLQLDLLVGFYRRNLFDSNSFKWYLSCLRFFELLLVTSFCLSSRVFQCKSMQFKQNFNLQKSSINPTLFSMSKVRLLFGIWGMKLLRTSSSSMATPSRLGTRWSMRRLGAMLTSMRMKLWCLAACMAKSLRFKFNSDSSVSR